RSCAAKMALNSEKKQFSFIDLFSGSGGLSLGFVQEGFEDKLAIEIDEKAAQTYKQNFPDSKVWVRDIRTVHGLEIIEEVKGTVDVVLASPPCEPFTAANPKRKKSPLERFYDTPQGDLIFHAIRIIGDLSPNYFVIENVVPIVDSEGREIIKEEFKSIGYNKIHFNFLSSEKYGCPSYRNRVFISNVHLEMIPQRKKKIEEVMLDLPSPSYPNDIPNHFRIPFAKQVKNEGIGIRKGHAAVYFKGASRENRNWTKLDEKDLAPTIMGKSRFIHPLEDRPLSVREQARLMSFPDSFIFTGSVEAMFNQIGESVPPIISKQIAKIIRSKLEKNIV
ncbi:MAG: DNA cytosine methyltransferase, partial [Candidatus Heimdallarchaeota archaeon]|nr:DNA cytosine methyltransferase [Candidatus Heimdallarchaeota archaeon]